jgi:2-iminobutanoate/2-iminopropanoate deaminase
MDDRDRPRYGLRMDLQYFPHDVPSLPFSAAVRLGDVLYLSGQIGNPPGNGRALVPGGVEAETRQAMENIKAVLERCGSSMGRVFKCTVMMADMKEWAAMNAVYLGYFPSDRKPARSAFGASGLALGARVEIECCALVGG